MGKRNLLIIETRNPYRAEKFEQVVKYVLGSNYKTEIKNRELKSHEGENDLRTYTRFKMMVTKTEEEFIKDEIRKMEYPNYSFGGAR